MSKFRDYINKKIGKIQSNSQSSLQSFQGLNKKNIPFNSANQSATNTYKPLVPNSPSSMYSPKNTTTPSTNPTPAITSNAGRQYVSNLAQSATPMSSSISSQQQPTFQSRTVPEMAKPKSKYLEYLNEQFNADKLNAARQNIDALTERTSKEILRAREREDELRKNEIGQLQTGQNYQLGENERLSNKSLADIAIAKGYQTDIYNQMLEAGATVYEAEQAQAEADNKVLSFDEAQSLQVPYGTTIGQVRSMGLTPSAPTPEGFSLSEGQSRYQYNPQTGQYDKIASVGKTYAPGTGGGSSVQLDNQTQYQLDKANNILGFIDQALEQAKFGTTGLAGGVLGGIAGTGANDLQNTLNTIKANIGFNELQAMRAASPTGGALGQVAVQELEALQSTLGSLKRTQSTAQLEANLRKIQEHYNNWKATLGGETQQPSQTYQVGNMIYVQGSDGLYYPQ